MKIEIIEVTADAESRHGCPVFVFDGAELHQWVEEITRRLRLPAFHGADPQPGRKYIAVPMRDDDQLVEQPPVPIDLTMTGLSFTDAAPDHVR